MDLLLVFVLLKMVVLTLLQKFRWSLQANAIPNFTETSRDIIGLMFTDGTHEGVSVVNDDANDVIHIYANDFNIVLDGDLSGQSTVSRLTNTTVTANITADYISHVTSDGCKFWYHCYSYCRTKF